jgi:acetolactate synthase-1/2/3 large subunit
MKATGARIIVKLIEREGVRYVSGIPGGANLPLYDALYDSGLRHVLARHEQGAGFIAQGMARSTGKPGVCIATSGPGATNLVTAIADAKLDSVPLVAITGQVSRSLLGTDAFQEVDTYGMCLPLVKHSYLVRSARELLLAVPDAFRIAASGRPGPVLLDIPKDVQLEEIEVEAWPEPSRPDRPIEADRESLERAAALIAESKRPFLYFGGGVTAAEAHEELAELSRKAAIPAAATLMGLGCLPPDHPLYLGMIGMHGSRAVNALAEEADLLIAVGARFDDRATGDVRRFAREARVLHIDADAAEIGKIRRVDAFVRADARSALAGLAALVPARSGGAWAKRARSLIASGSLARPRDEAHPRAIVRAIARAAGPEAIVTTDVGQHQMWAAQAYPVPRPRSFLSSGGLGTMGFGLPAAIGAALANPGRRVVCIAGDGSLLMNVQELATLAELGLDVSVFVFDNGHLGLVRQQQELFYGGRYSACRFDRRPDFAAIARGFGVEAEGVEAGSGSTEAIERALGTPGPSLLAIGMRAEDNVLPMVPPGGANAEAIGEEPLRLESPAAMEARRPRAPEAIAAKV